jgi:flagellar basal body-associated protein FliL
MYPEIGTFQLTTNTTMLENPIKISGDDIENEGNNEKPDKEKKPVSAASIVLLIIFIIILVILAVLIFFYVYSNIKRQKRARERRRDRLGDRSVYTKHRTVVPTAAPAKKKTSAKPHSEAMRPTQKPATSERGTRYAKEETATAGRRYKQ